MYIISHNLIFFYLLPMCIFQRAKNIAKLICFPALKVKGRSWSQNLGLKKWATSRNSIISPSQHWFSVLRIRIRSNKNEFCLNWFLPETFCIKQKKMSNTFFQCYGVYPIIITDKIRIRPLVWTMANEITHAPRQSLNYL